MQFEVKRFKFPYDLQTSLLKSFDIAYRLPRQGQNVGDKSAVAKVAIAM